MDDIVLSKVTNARLLLLEAKTIQDTKKVLDIAASAEMYARRQKMSQEAIQYATDLKIEALRQLGVMLKETPRNKGTRASGKDSIGGTIMEPPNDTPTLKELGIDKKTSSLAQQIASLPEEQFDAVKLGIITLEKAKKEIKKQANESARQERASQGIGNVLPENVQIICDDFNDYFQNVPDNSVDLIFTDPPYDKESIELYGNIALHAARVLKPGGSLLVYAGHYAIPKITQLMGEYLRYWWMIALSHQSGNHRRLEGVKVYVHWKPILWYVKDTYSGKRAMADLYETDQPDKELHEWAQDIGAASYYIDYLTEPGDLIIDPMCGSGTICQAAYDSGRRIIGIEIDEDRANVARYNLGVSNGEKS